MVQVFSGYETRRLARYGITLVDARRFGEMPVEHMTGYAEFYGREFAVDRRVMIPRVETEELVELALAYCKKLARRNPERPLAIADIGTGSGCIGITLFLALETCIAADMWLSDVSSDALSVARTNLKRLVRAEHRKHFQLLGGNLFADYPDGILFDLITANLPYLPTRRIPTLQNSVKNYEPHLALDGGKDGAETINKLLAELPRRLKPGGVAILEIDDEHTLSHFTIPAGFAAEIKKDLFGKNRFLVVKK